MRHGLRRAAGWILKAAVAALAVAILAGVFGFTSARRLVGDLEASIEDGDGVVLIAGPLVSFVAGPLEQRGVEVDSLPWEPIHAYYPPRLVPILRSHGTIWLVAGRMGGLLAKIRREFLTDYRVVSESHFGPLALIEVVDEFPSDHSSRVDLLPVASEGWLLTDIQFPPGRDDLFLATMSGDVRWRSLEGAGSGTVLDLEVAEDGGAGLVVGGECGLIGMAFHPRFDASRRFFTHSCWRSQDGTDSARVSEWRIVENAQGLRAVDEKIVIEIPRTHDLHNGGALVFGPDGYLYISVGDGHQGGLSARAPADTLRGKILRIDVDSWDEGRGYSIPESNPFADGEGFPPETWAWGFRNPWRIAFLEDGRLLAADVGENEREEISLVVPGRHHGWPYREGTLERYSLPDGLDPVAPIYEYGRDRGMSIIGGGVYRGSALPDLAGKYLFSDYLAGRLWALDLSAVAPGEPLTEDALSELGRWRMQISTFGRDSKGELYVGDLTGRAFRLVPPLRDGEPSRDSQPVALDLDSSRAGFRAEPPFPQRPTTRLQVELGARIYRDQRLSANGDVACENCHGLTSFGQNGERLAQGSNGVVGRRNVPTTLNAHRQFAQGWDYRVETVEEMAGQALLSQDRHGFATTEQVVQALRAVPGYEDSFRRAFADSAEPLNFENVVLALGAFVRSLTPRSRWDDFLDGDDRALDAEEKEGFLQFVGVGCGTCHQYRTLGGSRAQKLGLVEWRSGPDRGRFEVTGANGDEDFFKVPSLLNVAETAPYYHDGSIRSLEDSIRDMAKIQLGRELDDETAVAIARFLSATTADLDLER